MSRHGGIRSWLAVGALAGIVTLAWGQWAFRHHVPPTILRETNYDAFGHYYPRFAYAFAVLRTGTMPWWNPYQFCGQPFFAAHQHALLYPLSVVYLLFSTRTALRIMCLVHFGLGLLFTMALGRTIGLGWLAAMVAAALFMGSRLLTPLVALPDHLYGVIWMPAVLALAIRATREPRRRLWVVLLAAAVAAQYLGGYAQYLLFSCYLVGLFAIGHWLRLARAGRARQLPREALNFGLAAAVALLLMAPQLVPQLQLTGNSPRALGRLTPIALDPFPQSTLGTSMPLKNGAAAAAAATPEPLADQAAALLDRAGIIRLCLLAAAIVLGGTRPRVVYFVVLAVVAGVLALGVHTPVFHYYAALPTGAWFRLPARWMYVWLLATAMLAGIGMQALVTRTPPRRFLRIAAGLLGAGAVGISAAVSVPEGARVILLLVAAAIAAACIGSGGRRAGLALLCILVLVDAPHGAAVTFPLPETHPELMPIPRGAVAYLHAHQGLDRTYVSRSFYFFGTPFDGAPPNLGMLAGIYAVGGLENLITLRFADFAAYVGSGRRTAGTEVPQGDLLASSASPGIRLLDVVSARYVLASRRHPFIAGAATPRYPLRYQDDQYQVFENPDALPRAYLVGRYEVEPDPDRLLARLNDPGFDLRSTALLEKQPGGDEPFAPPAGSAMAKVTRYAATRVEIDTSAPRPALLVLTDQFYPGWVATVDGRVTEIYRANFLVRAVRVPAGQHRVVFTFSPAGWPILWVLASLALMGAVVAVVRELATRPAAPSHY
jgi:hypothetical protein